MTRWCVAIPFAALASTADAGWFGPSNYDECILENMNGVGSDMAARAVGAACARQFPPKKIAEKPLAPAATVPPSPTTPDKPEQRESMGGKWDGPFIPDTAK